MKRSLLFVALTVAVAGGCKKYRSNSDNAPPPSSGAGGGGFGAEQAVRKAVDRTVTAAELKELHLFMTNAKLAMGRVPTAQETWTEINKPDGNRQLAKMIQDGLIVLVPNPPDEGLWAYAKEAPTTGGWVLTHSEPRRVTPAEFAALQRGGS